MKSGSTGEEKGWVTDERSAAGMQVVLLKRMYVFPWTQLLYAEGTGEEVRAAFATHDVVIRGSGLFLLLEDLAGQRVIRLQEPSRTDKFAAGPGPRIAGVQVRKLEDGA